MEEMRKGINDHDDDRVRNVGATRSKSCRDRGGTGFLFYSKDSCVAVNGFCLAYSISFDGVILKIAFDFIASSLPLIFYYFYYFVP
ncbi:unnamed protein product [Citrullus colocynthis]|uniref:Transmembrane protein n=1 Tax=Citrullus colocynthis TaxID=252529 RepID=A0ABP0YHW4_9ROSI